MANSSFLYTKECMSCKYDGINVETDLTEVKVQENSTESGLIRPLYIVDLIVCHHYWVQVAIIEFNPGHR
jgi:hypothetical protein